MEVACITALDLLDCLRQSVNSMFRRIENFEANYYTKLRDLFFGRESDSIYGTFHVPENIGERTDDCLVFLAEHRAPF